MRKIKREKEREREREIKKGVIKLNKHNTGNTTTERIKITLQE